jgi:hypothetical protein
MSVFKMNILKRENFSHHCLLGSLNSDFGEILNNEAKL